MEPWYKLVTPRKEVREGRSFNPDEFAIALEQVVAGTAPEDYRVPEQFFARTCFTRALREHAGIVLRRLAGQTENTAPVLTLITQFGGGKTHTLTTLFHLASLGGKADAYAGVSELLKQAGLASVPQAKVAVFVGNAWDPRPGRETPWLDLARQLAGEQGVEALGLEAKTTPPGTEALGRLFTAADGPVLLLFDEVLNYLNRHHKSGDNFHAFIQNLTVAATGAPKVACVISLPRSQVEMTARDQEWLEKLTKVVRRVAKDLIANDEAEISEVIRRRLFEDLGPERARKQAAQAYADWCFERRHQLPPEWTSVEASQGKAREVLAARFEACYPFHPATLSVFQRKWQALPQYQQTRGTLAMLAQWISVAAQDSFRKARQEALITLGSAPLGDLNFRGAVLGQLGEPRLEGAIKTDLAGDQAHAKALDADTKGALRDVHQRVGAAILFESSGGQTDKVAHAPELRFALGGPDLDTTSVDNAALALEGRSYFLRRVGDGYRIGHTATLKKVVSDRRASLDEDGEIRPAIRALIQEEFKRGASVPTAFFPGDGTEVADSPKLNLVVLGPEQAWTGEAALRSRIAGWTRFRGQAPRLYPAALVWCAPQPGRDLRDKVEWWLAWKRVQRELNEGLLGEEHGSERGEVAAKLREAEGAAREAVWAAYRYALLADAQEPEGLAVLDLAPGHSSSGENLGGRVLTAMKNKGLLNESVGSGYLERHWPPALKENGVWPLAGLRQSFLDGSLTRLLDPDTVLRTKLPEFVAKGDFGLASGTVMEGVFERLWYKEAPGGEEVAFESGVFLVTKARAEAHAKKAPAAPALGAEQEAARPQPPPAQPAAPEAVRMAVMDSADAVLRPLVGLRLSGRIPPEAWNRVGTKLLPKLKSAYAELKAGVDLSISVEAGRRDALIAELRLILQDLGLQNELRIE